MGRSKVGGTWFRVDVGFLRHPKIQNLTDREVVLLLASWCWVAEQATDGVIPRAALRGIRSGFTPKLVEKFVRIGLWDEHPDGWCVHDWLDRNLSREQAERARAATAARVAKYRRKPMGNGVTNGTRHEVSTSPTSTSTQEAATPEPELGAQAPPPRREPHAFLDVGAALREEPPECLRALVRNGWPL